MSVGKQPVALASSNGLLPGEDADILREVGNLVADPESWLDASHARLGGNRPRDLIGTDREQFLRDLLRAIKYGMPT